MKKEMVEIAVYIAEDGKRFIGDEQACLFYESVLSILEGIKIVRWGEKKWIRLKDNLDLEEDPIEDLEELEQVLDVLMDDLDKISISKEIKNEIKKLDLTLDELFSEVVNGDATEWHQVDGASPKWDWMPFKG